MTGGIVVKGGILRLFLLNDTSFPIEVGASEVLRAPDSDPPPQWKKGDDWEDWPGTVHLFRTPDPKKQGRFIGACQCAYVVPLGSVPLDKSYTIMTPIEQPRYISDAEDPTEPYFMKFCVRMAGEADGTRITAGFGLYNLITRPKDWTYIYPKPFADRFGFYLRNGMFENLLYCSFEDSTYPSLLVNPKPQVRCVFSLRGAGFHFQGSRQPTQEEMEGKSGLHQEIVADTEPFVITNH